jgi:DNA-binding CsgD family transcriptional regulator
MHVSGREQIALGRIFATLADDMNEREVRLALGRALLDLLRADHFASFVWDPEAGRFGHGVWLNMSEENLARYDTWYQFRDPITFALQARRHATAVSEVMLHRELIRTEFFTDFLSRDGLCWGINLHAFDPAGRALGDLRIWRSAGRQDFVDHDKRLLDLIEPALITALRRLRDECSVLPAAGSPAAKAQHPPAPILSARERQVAQAVLQGLTDKEIALSLGVSVSTVRTYLNRVFDKTGTHRRAGLSRLQSLSGSAGAAGPAAPRSPDRSR